MKCRDIQPLLSKLQDEALSPRKMKGLAAHLEACLTCRQRREAFREIGAALREFVEKRLPEDLAQRPMERRALEQWRAERDPSREPGRRAAITRPFVTAPPTAGAWRLALAAVAMVAVGLGVAHWASSRPRGSVTTVQGPRLGGKAPEPRTSPGKPTRSQPSADPTNALRVTAASTPSGTPRDAAPSMPHRQDPPPPADHLTRNAEGPTTNAQRLTLNTVRDELEYLNGDPELAARGWAPQTLDAWQQIEARVRETVRVRDDFVTVPFPRLADASGGQVSAALASYKQEAAIVDARLAREITVQAKGMALVDLCDRLRQDTGIRLEAGRSVADEKVTLFCRERPLREVMRQLSRPFGYMWLRSGKEGEYRYELTQDLRSQLVEEELRNRDRNAALVALDEQMSRFRPYLELSPNEVLARASAAPREEKPLLDKLAGNAWGPAQLYFRLTPNELAALRGGQTLTFSADPEPGELPLPPDMTRPVLESHRTARVLLNSSGKLGTIRYGTSQGFPPVDFPEIVPKISLSITQTEPGTLTLKAAAGLYYGLLGHRSGYIAPVSLATGRGPDAASLRNATANAELAREPALQARVTVRPEGQVPRQRVVGRDGAVMTLDPRVTSADLLEALHAATGLPIVADYYTRLESVSLGEMPIFDALNHLADWMGMRWQKDGEWLQLRSVSFFHDRLKEVPNRLLERWAAARRQRGHLDLEELIEIGGLSDPQLDSPRMADGARVLYGLTEWDFVRQVPRPHLRFLASLTPLQRRQAADEAGLPFAQMTLPQQQSFLKLALGGSSDNTPPTPEELTVVSVRASLTPANGFRWNPPFKEPSNPNAIGPPPVFGPTREATLAAARRIDPSVTDAQILPGPMELHVRYAMGRPGAPKGSEYTLQANMSRGDVAKP